ncbi:MAG TPA: G1 family glutamic endopeptidase [Gaiellaceae bacterium]|nr:G1 family glutamic endopeptidase [Gaiellaceae bacterium]
MRALAVFVVVLGVGTSAALVPRAAAAASPKPVVVSVSASPARLPAAGGSVRVTARVRNATTCTFRHEPSPSAPLRKDAVVRCASGRASASIRLDANASTQAVTLRFDVQAARNGKSAHRTVSVVEAAAPTPLSVATSTLNGTSLGAPYSAALAASGGTPPYTWSVASGFLPSGLTLDGGGTIAGTPTSSGRFPVTVQIVDAAGQIATASLSLAVTPPLLPVEAMAFSSNWSGYALQGASFTFAMGTFTVPTNSATSGRTDDSEWVGVDGAANSSLIQAGVAEDTAPDGSHENFAWWEIIPAASTPISSIDVSPGDTVTVMLRQVGAGSWTIEVIDVTKNESFSTTQSYSGPGASAEWIVEAATDLRSNQVVTVGPYFPPVTFTDLGWAGDPNGGFLPIQLEQGSAVSAPSGLNPTQTAFGVGYGAAPATPS